MVVSWISKDKIPMDGSCFDPPAQVVAPGNFTGSSPPTPFPYPIKAGCTLAGSQVRFVAVGPASTRASDPTTQLN